MVGHLISRSYAAYMGQYTGRLSEPMLAHCQFEPLWSNIHEIWIEI